MWKILLILEPVGNGAGPGGEDGVWEKGDGARGNLFGKSHLENLKRGQSVRDGGRDGVVGSGQGHGSTYFIRWSRSGQTQAGVNEEGLNELDLWLVPSVPTDATFAPVGLPLASEASAVALVVVVVRRGVKTVPGVSSVYLLVCHFQRRVRQ